MAFVENRWRDAKTKQPTSRDGKGLQWRVRYTDPDGRERSRSFARKGDADRFRTEVEAAILRGTYLDPAAGKILLRDYAREWLASRNMDITSRKTVAGRIERHIIPSLGGRELKQLARTPTIISGWLAGLTVSDSYKGDIFSTLSAVFTAAVDNSLITSNPCRVRSVPKPKVTRRKVIPWTRDQVDAVRAELPARYAATADCGAWLGLRQGEILGLEEGAVEFLRRIVIVRLQVRTIAGGAMVFAPPKRGRERTVPLPGPVALALSEHIRRFPPRPVTLPWRYPDGEPRTARLIFTGPRGGAVNRNHFNTTAWRPARRKAGLAPARENGMHALRHFYASSMLAGGPGARGVDIKTLSEYLGHHDPGFTLRIYAHLMPEAADRALRAIESVMAETAPGRPQELRKSE